MVASRSYTEALSTIDASKFDWEAYEGTYTGRARINRLKHLITICLAHPSPSSNLLARNAILRLIPRLKSETWDLEVYLEMLSALYSLSHAGQSWIPLDDMDVDGNDNSGRLGELSPAIGKGMTFRPPDNQSGKEEDGFPDEDWINNVRETATREFNRLDVELRGYMSNLIRESIRLTHLAFAQLATKVGNLDEALKYFAAAREYSSSPQHHIDLGVSIIETCLAFNSPAYLAGHISKLEANLDRLHPPSHANKGNQGQVNMNTTASDIREMEAEGERSKIIRKSVTARIQVAKGLLALSQKDYSKTTRELAFITDDIGPLLSSSFEGTALSSSDLALITIFTAMMSADRNQIRRAVLERGTFRALVGDEYSWGLDIVRSFVDADYKSVSGLLEMAEPYLLLNPFLSKHASSLIQSIQTTSLLQYVQPFSTVKLSNMSHALNLPPQNLLDDIEALIENGKLKGRIDLIDEIIVMDDTDWREQMFTKAMAVGKKSTTLSQAALFKMKLEEAGITVDPRTREHSIQPVARIDHQSSGEGALPSGANTIAVEGAETVQEAEEFSSVVAP
ncbi:hypothetical protein L204_101277 [Cryptococcus depauperatus]